MRPDPDGRLLDRLGRTQPGRMNVLTFARAIPGFLGQFTPVGKAHFKRRHSTKDYEVACPCGQRPVVEDLRMAECQCGRIYTTDGQGLYVANSPVLAGRT